MTFEWKPEYTELCAEFLNMHFGGTQGLTTCFPCMKDVYPWSDHRYDVVDPRVHAKTETEYRGLESYAAQYHATAQYEYSYHHWLLAAFSRQSDMKANNFEDQAHLNGIRYAIKQALYNKALHQWQELPTTAHPEPEAFGLSGDDREKLHKALRRV